MPRRRVSLLVTVALLAALALGSAFLYRKSYGTWWGTPERIAYCGRTYDKGTQGLTWAQVQAFATPSSSGQVLTEPVEVTRVPPLIGQRVFAAAAPGQRRVEPGAPCAMGVFLETGEGRYTAYGLSGGP